MSTKFNPSSSKQAPPPQCHKSPDPPIIPPPLYLPERLIGFVSWHDADPAMPLTACRVFILRKTSGSPIYHGRSHDDIVILGATITLDTPPHGWAVQIHAWDIHRNPETLDMPGYTYQTATRFDTGLLQYWNVGAYWAEYCRFTD